MHPQRHAETNDDLKADVFFTAGGLETQDLLKEQVSTSEVMPAEAREAVAVPEWAQPVVSTFSKKPELKS
tara:strand:- start:2399 stop:2608 length:210 start_codon:yes stop_codon:yes gene_type:complete